MDPCPDQSIRSPGVAIEAPALRSGKLAQQSTYANWVERLRARRGKRGLEASIGGEFAAFGIIELEMLKFFGLHEQSCLIDVGCGAGRLAIPLAGFLRGRYLGTDIVPDLVDHARQSCNRPDWRFQVIDSLRIPAPDASADMVCFFSVFTHLLHEQAYLYLAEAKRVLKPGGRIVLSFLEFAIECHWDVFQATVADEQRGGGHPLNVFTERNALATWAHKLGLGVEQFRDGTEPFVPLPHPVRLEDGRVMQAFGNLGQSICVLVKPPA